MRHLRGQEVRKEITVINMSDLQLYLTVWYFREAMSKGASIHWSEALQILTGHNYLTTEPFLQYYEPVYIFLRDYIRDNNVYVGW